MIRKKILFVLPFAPYPLTSGGSQAMFNGIAVVKEDYEVFVTFRTNKCDDANIAEFNALMDGKVKVIPYVSPSSKVVKPTIKQRLYRFILKVENKLRKSAGFDFTSIRIPHRAWVREELFPKETRFAKHVCGIINEYGINIVQSEMLCNVTVGLALPPKVRKIFVHHELGWVVHTLDLQTQEGDAFDQTMWLDYYKTCEIALLNTYDAVVTLSPIDTKKLQEAGVRSRIYTSMAVVNTPQDNMLSTEGWNVLSFVGPDCNLPNIAGIKWFLDNVWERLLQEDSSYRLQIIGHWSENRIAEIMDGHKNVEYLGFVDDLASVLRDTIMIVPITIGSGIRMKILESASMGVPFVTTSVGVEGIPVQNGTHGLIADTPSDFFEAILKLRDDNVRKQLVMNANRLVKENYSLEVLRNNRAKIYIDAE